MGRDVLGSGVLVDVADMVDGAANSIQQSGTAPHLVIAAGHGLNVPNVRTIVNDLADVVEQDGGNVDLPFLCPLLLNGGVKAPDGVGLKARHGTATVKDEYEFSGVVFHEKTSLCFCD